MSLDILQEWGMKENDAQLVMDALRDNKKIIITGQVRSGKTKLLNELIRMKPEDQHFQYRANKPLSDYELEPEHQARIARSWWSACFLVIDEDPDYLKRNLDYPQPILATYIVPHAQQQFQFDRQIQPLYDVVITLNRYKEVWEVRKITIHDRLLYKANIKYDQTKKELETTYPFGAPIEIARLHWFGSLTPAEKAAAQLAAMNRSVENGGMSGWYQADGATINQDLPDFLTLSTFAQANGISGFDFLHNWITRVRDEYLPAMREMDVGDHSKLPISDTLERQYWAWENRCDRFDELLELLNSSQDNTESEGQQP